MTTYECAYCGQLGASTKDHVPAKCLYLRPLPRDLPTVRACTSCNAGASDDDEYFRDTVLKWHRVSDKPQVQPLVGKMLRAISLPQKRAYVEMTMASMGEAEVQTVGGILLGKQPVIRVQAERMVRVAERYVRGLHRYTFGRRVHDDVMVKVAVDPQATIATSEGWGKWFGSADIHIVQPGGFSYAHVSPIGRPDAFVWLLMFYDEFPVLGFVRPADQPGDT